MASKACTLCKQHLPLTDFYRDGERRRSECKRCLYGKQRQRADLGATHWLQEQVHKLEWKREAEDAFEEAVSRPSAYELRNMGSGHGMPVNLGDERHGVFWSKGWRGCEFNCGKRVDDWDAPMYVTVTRRDGSIVWRKSCTPTQEE